MVYAHFPMKLPDAAKLITLIVLSLGLLMSIGCESQKTVSPDNKTRELMEQKQELSAARPYTPVITIGKLSVTRQEVRDSFMDMFEKPREGTSDEEVSGRTLELAISRNLLYLEANERGLVTDPDLQLEWDVKGAMWLGEYFMSKKRKEFAISPEAIEALMPKSRSALKLSQITVEDLAAAQDLRQRVLDGMDFASLAREYSTDPAAPSGGRLKMELRPGFGGVYTDELKSDISETDTGELTSIMSTPMGYTFFRVESKRPLTAREEKSLRTLIGEGLERDSTVSYRRAVEERYPLHVNKEQLDRVFREESPGELVVGRVGSYDVTYDFLLALAKMRKEDSDFSLQRLRGLLSALQPYLAYREQAVSEGVLDDELVMENLKRVRKYALTRTIVRKLAEESRPDLKQAYEFYKNQLRSIWVSAAFSVEGARGLTMDEASALAEAMRSGGNFEDAVLTALPGSSYDLVSGTFGDDDLRPEEILPLELTPSGKVTDPIPTGGNGKYSVFRMLGKSRGEVPPFDEVSDQVLAQFARKNAQELRSRIIIEQKAKVKLEYLFPKESINGIIIDWYNMQKALEGISPPGGFHQGGTGH